jgi:membrane-associated protease RseP (regulator of RpoE activity)
MGWCVFGLWPSLKLAKSIAPPNATVSQIFQAGVNLWMLAFIVLALISLVCALVLQAKLTEILSVPIVSVSCIVHALEENSLLYRSGLRCGDVIVSVNGRLIKDARYLQNWWFREDVLELKVMRDNQEIRLVVKKP